MSELRAQIDDALKTARRERDEATKNVIGMIKNKVLTELKSGKGVEETDELWKDAIASYAKQVRKSIEQFEAAGDRGVEALAEAKFELEFCERYLPKKLDEAQTRELVKGIMEAQKIDDPKQMGRLMGDAGLVQKVARELLAGG